MHAVGQQGGSQGIADEPRVGLAVEGESDAPRTVDAPAIGSAQTGIRGPSTVHRRAHEALPPGAFGAEGALVTVSVGCGSPVL